MRALLDLLLPPRCLACGRVCPAGHDVSDAALCSACAVLLEPDGAGWVLDGGVVAVAPLVYADPLAAAIKRVKTDGLRAGARALTALLGPHLPGGAPRTWVPAPPGRARRRGLDLPQVLAGPGAVRLLRTTSDRPDQGHLGAAARRRAARGAFVAIGPVPPAVVLVDDVRATGATALAAADALRAAGARRVLAISLAASPGRPSAARPPPDGPGAGGPGTAAGSGRSW